MMRIHCWDPRTMTWKNRRRRQRKVTTPTTTKTQLSAATPFRPLRHLPELQLRHPMSQIPMKSYRYMLRGQPLDHDRCAAWRGQSAKKNSFSWRLEALAPAFCVVKCVEVTCAALHCCAHVGAQLDKVLRLVWPFEHLYTESAQDRVFAQ